MVIREDDLQGDAIADLLREHLEYMRSISPPESTHALDLAELRTSEITFWSAWDGGQLLGCGALKQLSPEHAEIKSMRTVKNHLRKGIAAKMLSHIIEEAKTISYHRLSLETGSMDEFIPARKLYERHGFIYTAPFGNYKIDPHSVFMTLEL